MRITLTLDDAVARRLERRATATGRTFEQVVNEVLYEEAGRLGEPYRIEPVSLGGVCTGLDLDKALAVSATLEDEEKSARESELRE